MTTLPELLRQDVESICYKHGRKVGSAGHERARKHLVGCLQELGCEPYACDSLELPYKANGISFCNLAGRIAGSDRDAPPLLIGAHYDSVIAHPCADDNAAAVAIALHAVRLLRAGPRMKRDLIVALFDAEEPPYFQTNAMGSNWFYEDHVHGKTEIHAALVMDLVGPFYDPLMKWAGVPHVDARANMDRFVDKLIYSGL